MEENEMIDGLRVGRIEKGRRRDWKKKIEDERNFINERGKDWEWNGRDIEKEKEEKKLKRIMKMRMMEREWMKKGGKI